MTTELALLSQVAYHGREITAPRLRGLLALLAGDLRTGCGTGRLVEGLWPDELPERPGKAVQVLVSRLRAQLGAELIVSTPTGYRLALDEAQVDSSALLLYEAASAERARAGDHEGVLAQAEAGLALWDASVGAGAGEDLHDPVVALRADRVRAHRALVRFRALALARVGRREEAAAPLAGLARELPRDEELLAELLRCEAATAGRAAALTRYDAYRRRLRDELGTDPGPGLRSVYQELLRADVPTVRHGVPHEPNPLLGRDADVAAVSGLLREARVVTVVGPGGLGKTRLSHAVSRAAAQPVVHFVTLAGVLADDDVAGEVASAVGAGEGRFGGDAVGGTVAALGAGPALLVLDNCEQVIPGAADLVQALVSRSKELRVLATSRAPLGLTSESVYALPELSPATSVELFTQRARAARPGVELPADQVAEICRHLDGLPLAVELAAARVRVLSVADISRRLRDRFALLRGGARDAPERHRTLQAVVEWSWNLLEADGRAAMRALSVFPGGFTEDAAQYALGESADALTLLEQLAGQSLIKVGDTPSGLRFHMLETLREFSAARRAEAGEEEAVTARFLLWARDFGRAHHDVLFSGGPQRPWIRIRAEQDNLVLALRYALARADGPSTAALTAVLGSWWSTGSNYARLAALAEETGGPLSHFRPSPENPEDVETARSAATVCTACLFMGRGPYAVRHLVTLRRLPPAPPDTLTRALAIVLGAFPEIHPPRYTRLQELCDADAPLLAGMAAGVASYVWEAEHDTERALVCARRMLDTLGPLENPAMRLIGHGRISELCLKSGHGAEAYDHLRAALGALDEVGDWTDTIGVRWGLVLACLQRGEVDEAEYWLGLAALEQSESAETFGTDLPARAEIALARGLTEVGLGLWRQAVERIREGSLLHADDPFVDPWSLEIQSAALAAHAQCGRLEPVAGLAERLRERLLGMLSGASADGSPAELPVYGTVLLALGFAGLAGGDPAAVRLVALAERMPAVREFPTLSSARSRQAAENADRAAYDDARSTYATLKREELRAAALRELSAAARG
ncbi:BTAD domain-containing putative transcriptional regulator [Streptomyces avermitilis]|uniref:ATP-binding protein n=1 Tax=Streptomyces avermitilis TaxID=33903 RepID=UPI0033FB8226